MDRVAATATNSISLARGLFNAFSKIRRRILFKTNALPPATDYLHTKPDSFVDSNRTG